MTSHQGRPEKRAARAEREIRQAAALRANLKRRKQAAKSSKPGESQRAADVDRKVADSGPDESG